MKKFILLMFVSIFTFIGMNAQTAIQTPKFLDNTYVGFNAGVSTPLSFDHMFPLNTVIGVKVGKNLTPVVGLNVEGTTWLGSNTTTVLGSRFDTGLGHNAFRAVNVGLNGTLNLTNLFLGYNPDKVFEVSTETGLGWLHTFNANENNSNDLSAKTGLIFAWNLGNSKAWQITAEPTVYWNLTRQNTDYVNSPKFNKDHAQLAVLAGVVYKFKTSNGTHNFKIYDVGALNDEINNLRNELAKKPKEVVHEVVKNEGAAINNARWVVFFEQGSSTLSDDDKAILDEIPDGTVVDIVGHASAEGSVVFNKSLSEARAATVSEYLAKRNVTTNTKRGDGKVGIPTNRVVIVTAKN